MIKQEILDKIGLKGIMDLYHMESCPKWLIMDTGEVISGIDATLIQINNRDFKSRSGSTEWAEAIIYGESRKVYGVIYFKEKE